MWTVWWAWRMCVCVSRFLFVYANVLTYLSQKIRWKRYRLTAIILWNQLVFIAVVGYLLCASMQFINIFGSYRLKPKLTVLRRIEKVTVFKWTLSFGMFFFFFRIDLPLWPRKPEPRKNQSVKWFLPFSIFCLCPRHGLLSSHARTHTHMKKIKSEKQ